MEKVVIFGNGQNATWAHFYLTHDSPYEVVAFTVDKANMKEAELVGLPVVSFEDVQSIYPPDEYKMFVPIGSTRLNKLRAEKYYQSKDKGYQLISYICSKNTHWGDISVGDNCYIQEDNVIQPYVKIGNDVFISSGNHLAHHAIIGDHCFISSHVVISGNVTIEPYCFLGVNSTIRDGVTIARECVIGAGTVILKDTKEKEVYTNKSTELLPIPSDKLKKI